MVESNPVVENAEMAQAEGEAAAATEATPEVVAAPVAEFLPCDESSDEYMLLCGCMEQFEALTSSTFGQFVVVGVRKEDNEEGTKYDAKIQVSDGETPVLHCQVQQYKDAEKTPTVLAIKNDQAVDAEFTLGAPGADVEMSQEGQELPKGQSISSMVNQGEATMLQDMGFSKIVSEKALFMV